MTKELYIEAYSPKYKNLIEKLLVGRNLEASLVNDLPQVGFLAFHEGDLVAAGFLRGVEGSYAMLDSYITDSNKPSEIRDLALDLITDNLLTLAKYENISKVLAFSADPNTIARAEKHGLTILKDHVFQVISLS